MRMDLYAKRPTFVHVRRQSMARDIVQNTKSNTRTKHQYQFVGLTKSGRESAFFLQYKAKGLCSIPAADIVAITSYLKNSISKLFIFPETLYDTALAREQLNMCIVFLYFCDNPSPDGYRLIIASNRDEFYFRPTAHAKFWEENPSIIAGMDLEAGKEGGTWLGMATNGKFAAITNYRQGPKFIDPNARGRGNFVPDFLKGDVNVESYLKTVSSQSDEYNGFNLLVGKLLQTGETKVGWYCNIEEKHVTMLKPGIHVLSNKVLNCSWPKMAYGRERFAEILEDTSTKKELIDKLMGLLNVRQRTFSCGDEKSFFGPQDEGVNTKMIQACQAIFVNCKEHRYGTRTNTVVLVDGSGHATYVERTMEDDATDPDEAEWILNTHEFDITQENNDCSDDKSPEENLTSVTTDITQETNDCSDHKSTEENLTSVTNANEEHKDHATERTHEQPDKNHSKKRKLRNGTTLPVEPAKKVIVKD